MKKTKVVIFDLDGTLANTLPLCIQAFKQSIEPLVDRSVSDEEIIATFGPSEEGTIMKLAPTHYEKGVASYLSNYEQLHDMCPTLFDGVKDLLNELEEAGVHIAMVTGKGKHSTDISLERFGLTHFFEFIETGSPSGPRKVAGIMAIMNSFPAIEKEEFIYVGDAPSDIIASREAGISVVAAAWAETAEPHALIDLKPDELFYSIEDFANWICKRV